MGKLFKFLTGRLFLTSIFILIQIATLFFAVFTLSTHSAAAYIILYVVSLIMAILVASGEENPSFRIAWLILMTVFPVFGWLFYYMFSYRKPFKKTLCRLKNYSEQINALEKETESVSQNLELGIAARRQINYLENIVKSRVRINTQTLFFKSGEEFFPMYLEKLRSAEKFIFIEYFIINKGIMWDSILEILKEKAKIGVDVRILYDDMGTINHLPSYYPQILKSYGIKSCIFNKYHASIDSFLNSRDHRKITVIDGKFCFTGGLNLSDEYINEVTLHGHWKDCALMLCGDAVDDMTASFLTLWHFSKRKRIKDEEAQFFCAESKENDGVVVCFEDEPYDRITVGKSLYMNLISTAQDHIYICTPYLILDNEIAKALKLSAQSGVNVKIVTPHIPDKKWVHEVTRANYDRLIESGVEIYEYTKGFVHSKMICADGDNAIVSTVNFDFRSFYMHFENGVYMYKSNAVSQVCDDFASLFLQCEKIAYGQFSSKNPLVVLKRRLLKLFSPLM